MKLELKHLVPYLPYKVEVEFKRNIYPKKISHEILTINTLWLCESSPLKFSIKPLLLPMSSLYTEMEDGKVPIVELAKMVTGIDWYKRGWEHSDIYEISTVSNDGTIYFSFSKDSFSLKFRAKTKLKCTTWVVPNQLDLFTYLFENHFDVYGLIDKGLALDKTKIK